MSVARSPADEKGLADGDAHTAGSTFDDFGGGLDIVRVQISLLLFSDLSNLLRGDVGHLVGVRGS